MTKLRNDFFPTDYEAFIYKSRYARWDDDKGRREEWDETVSRYTDFLFEHVRTKHNYIVPIATKTEIYNAILNFDVMPSMRALMSAGPALERDNTAGYNCSFIPVDHPWAFDEAMYILMCGTGVGFSVEDTYVSQLPTVPAQLLEGHTDPIIVPDSKEGWATSLRDVIDALYKGLIPTWDMSLVRPAGARLKTFGGRASGPEPLVDLFEFVVQIFRNAAGRKLTDLEAHDLMCKIGEVVVVGGVRRSAMISLSDLSSGEMATAKSGAWWEEAPQRALANNSVSYHERPNAETFLKEWHALVASQSGERGIFNTKAAHNQAAKNGRRKLDYELNGTTYLYQYGTNPCSEIILRPYQFCNL